MQPSNLTRSYQSIYLLNNLHNVCGVISLNIYEKELYISQRKELIQRRVGFYWKQALKLEA